MMIEQVIEAKIYRLEELKKYQSYYGPNTPYPVIVEMNELEAELRQLLSAGTTRPTKAIKQKKSKKRQTPIWQMSQLTIDAIATIAFIGLVFLLGSIIFATYAQLNKGNETVASSFSLFGELPPPTLRPTFTPTLDPNTVPVAVVSSSSGLPPANRQATDIPTTVPTLTPHPTDMPTFTPMPTETALPTNTRRPLPTATPAPPTSTPAPVFPFTVIEQGNRQFQRTSYHAIVIYIAVIGSNGIPAGDYKVVGDSSTGQHAESGLSDWNWSVANCLDCDYVKQGNLKFEPGSFINGNWNIYLADQSGTQLSAVIPLPYSENRDQWVWDFIIFKQQ